jgi:hypothetical protein
MSGIAVFFSLLVFLFCPCVLVRLVASFAITVQIQKKPPLLLVWHCEPQSPCCKLVNRMHLMSPPRSVRLVGGNGQCIALFVCTGGKWILPAPLSGFDSLAGLWPCRAILDALPRQP